MLKMKLLFENLKNQNDKFGFLLLLLIISKILLSIGLNFFDGSKSFLDEVQYSRFDSAHYLSIAESGYECFSCFERFGGSWNQSDWCGNAGWFPGYPITIKLFNFWIKDFTISAYILNHIFLISSIFVIINIFEQYNIKQKSSLLLLGIVSPGFIYYYAIFPIIGTLFFILLSFYGFVTKNNIIVAIGIFCASIYYPTGSFIVIPLFITNFILSDQKYKALFVSLYQYIIPSVLGLLVVFLMMYIETGYFDAYFKVSQKYNNHWHLPFAKMFNQMIVLLENNKPFETRNIQSTLCVFGVLIIFLINARRYYLSQINDLEILSTVYILVYLFIPWSLAGDFSSYRSEALLLPFIFCFRSYDYRLIFILIVVFSLLGIYLSYDFFAGKII